MAPRTFLLPLLLSLISGVGTISARAQAAPPPAAARLAAQCDELIRTAIKRPYGWAWPVSEDAAIARPKNASPKSAIVSFEPGETPSAGLVLLLAGELLDQPKYTDAARNVARGLAAAQQPSGRFPARPLFNPTSAAGNEAVGQLADRAPTRAALALLLSLSSLDEGFKDDALTRSAARGAGWLMRQQVESGAWPIPYVNPADPKKIATRLVRMDAAGDARECVTTMLLANDALGDPFHAKSAERGLAFLLACRTGAGAERGAGLWQTAYAPTGQAAERAAGFPDAFDTLASRRCGQAMFDGWLALGDGPRLTAAELVVKSIDDLVKNVEDGLWHRRFNWKGQSIDPAPDKSPGASPFGPPAGAVVEAPPPSDPGLPSLTAGVTTARELGREKFRAKLAAGPLPVRRRLALAAGGLWEGATSGELPAGDLDTWVKRNAATFGEGRDAADLPARVARTWESFLRALAERDKPTP